MAILFIEVMHELDEHVAVYLFDRDGETLVITATSREDALRQAETYPAD